MSENGNSTANKERIKEAVHMLAEGMDFQIQEMANELVITNPGDPEKGQLHVDFEHGYMSWERVVWEYFGTVVPGLGEEGTRRVTRETIEGLLRESSIKIMGDSRMDEHICAKYVFRDTTFFLRFSHGFHSVIRGTSSDHVLELRHLKADSADELWRHMAEYLLCLPLSERFAGTTIGTTEIAVFKDGDYFHIAETGQLGMFAIRVSREHFLDTLLQRQTRNMRKSMQCDTSDLHFLRS